MRKTTMPYSNDLRQKILDLISRKEMSISAIAKLFNISRHAIYSWIKLQKETNSVNPRKNSQPGHSHKIIDVEKFKHFINANPGKTVAELATLWGNIAAKTLRKWLHKLGFTRKKTVIYTENGTKKSVLYFWSR